MDGKRLSEDEDDADEQFLVEEAVLPPSDAPEMEVVSDLNSGLFKYHGKTLYSYLLFFPFQGPAQELDSGDKHGTHDLSLFSFPLFLILEGLNGHFLHYSYHCFSHYRWPCEKDP